MVLNFSTRSCPLVLKMSVTHQRLMDKIFIHFISTIIEVYVDNMEVKSPTTDDQTIHLPTKRGNII